MCTNFPAGEDPDNECGETQCNGTGACICADSGPGEETGNDTQDTAHSLGNIDDCDDEMSLNGIIASPTDEDWYSFAGGDGWCNAILKSSINIEGILCAFVVCAEDPGETEVSCDTGQPATSESGYNGCCGKTLEVSTDCSGVTDNVNVYLKISSDELQCVPYVLKYEF